MLTLLPTMSWAVRPPNGGLFSYSDDDVLTYLDGKGGLVRVHYSSSGPNAAPLDDLDEDGRPDFPALAAEVGEEALLVYTQTLGLRPPLDDTSLNVFDDGGSSAIDVYLVDFAGQADGNFSRDNCNADGACAGAIIVENDFQGYGYRSVDEALETVVSHELFHAIEAAYVEATPIWVSEGLAVWAERQFAPESRDFLAFASAYLGELDRPFHRPPGGPVPSFAYGVGLWWEFLSIELGLSIAAEYLDALEGQVPDDDAALELLIGFIEGSGQSLSAFWDRFALYNLATGTRAGNLESYWDADRMYGLRVQDVATEGELEATRFYPLTAHYYAISLARGNTFFGASKLDGNLRGTLVETDASGIPTVVSKTFSFDQLPLKIREEGVEPGQQFLIVTNSAVGTNSIRSELCFGESSEALLCLPEDSIGGEGESGQVIEAADTGCTQSQVTELWGLCVLWLLAHLRRSTAQWERR